MELSLFSREVIAMSTAVALTHNMFDAALCLGVCDKIVPGLLIGALHFGHLPAMFVPAGPMTSGLSNSDKAKVRQLYAQGKCDRDELLEGEAESYHGAGTCTFYGTANSNQMLMEVMGLHLPGSAFITRTRRCATRSTAQAARRVLDLTVERGNYMPIGHVVDEKAIVNGIVALAGDGRLDQPHAAPGGDCAAAGIVIDWDDFDDAVASRAAARQDLSERQGRREPLPRGRRRRVPGPQSAGRRLAARRRDHRRGQGPRSTTRKSRS